MAKKLLVVMYPGVADWEVSFPLFCLRPKIEETFAALGRKRLKTAMGFELETHLMVDGVDVHHFDGVFLPGGADPQNGRFPRSLGEDTVLLETLRRFADQGKVIGAICGAPLVLGAAGLLNGKRFACDITKDTRGWFEGAIRVKEHLAVDGNLITASVQAILPFSIEFARLLGGEDIAKEIEDFFVR